MTSVHMNELQWYIACGLAQAYPIRSLLVLQAQGMCGGGVTYKELRPLMCPCVTHW